jgi:hypothetical protein
MQGDYEHDEGIEEGTTAKVGLMQEADAYPG